MSNNEEEVKKAIKIVAYYTVAASGTGAIPVPGASAAIVVENTAMVAHISNVMNEDISFNSIVKCFGVMGTLNIAGRQVFIEGAKLLSWGTGSIWALVLLSALGATTAGVQTYIIGRLAIEIAKNNGLQLTIEKSSEIIDESKVSYDEFVKEWKGKELKKPE